MAQPKTGPTLKLAQPQSQYWPNPNTGSIPKLVQFQIWFKFKSSFYEDKNLYIFQMWTLSDRLSPNRSNPGHCLSQAPAGALLGLYFLLYKILNFLGPSRKVKLELGLIQPGPFSKFRARALKKWILIWIVLFYKITQEFQVLNGIKYDKMVVMGWTLKVWARGQALALKVRLGPTVIPKFCTYLVLHSSKFIYICT